MGKQGCFLNQNLPPPPNGNDSTTMILLFTHPPPSSFHIQLIHKLSKATPLSPALPYTPPSPASSYPPYLNLFPPHFLPVRGKNRFSPIMFFILFRIVDFLAVFISFLSKVFVNNKALGEGHYIDMNYI